MSKPAIVSSVCGSCRAGESTPTSFSSQHTRYWALVCQSNAISPEDCSCKLTCTIGVSGPRWRQSGTFFDSTACNGWALRAGRWLRKTLIER
jgi:hypothetical protein